LPIRSLRRNEKGLKEEGKKKDLTAQFNRREKGKERKGVYHELTSYFQFYLLQKEKKEKWTECSRSWTNEKREGGEKKKDYSAIQKCNIPSFLILLGGGRRERNSGRRKGGKKRRKHLSVAKRITKFQETSQNRGRKREGGGTLPLHPSQISWYRRGEKRKDRAGGKERRRKERGRKGRGPEWAHFFFFLSFLKGKGRGEGGVVSTGKKKKKSVTMGFVFRLRPEEERRKKKPRTKAAWGEGGRKDSRRKLFSLCYYLFNVRRGGGLDEKEGRGEEGSRSCFSVVGRKERRT